MRKTILDHMVAFSAVVSALGIVFAGWQVVLISRQISDAADQSALIKDSVERNFDQSRRATAYRALLDWSHDQPVSAAKCVELVAAMDQTTFNALIDRAQIELPTILHEKAQRCFSDMDIDLLPKFFDGERLTRRGSSLVAERVRNALNADEHVARAVKYELGNKEMIDEGIKNAIKAEDSKIIEMLDAKLERKSYSPLTDYLKSAPATKSQ
jgi:hypothetical protein